MACELVDCSEDWTPPGSFALCESGAAATDVFCSESGAAATKRPAGTEINPSFANNLSPYCAFNRNVLPLISSFLIYVL